MAKNEQQNQEFEIVGDSVQEPVSPTKVPRAGNVPSEAVAPEQQMDGIQQRVQQNPALGQAMDTAFPSAAQEALGEFELLPDYANGLSPDAPINKSPVEIIDRLKLVTGNTPGKLKYLKQKFEDAIVDKSGDILVKKEGLWHRVDANGLGDGDAWDMTKELVKDAADLSDIALAAAGSAVSGAKGAALGSLAGPAGTVAGGLAGAAAGGGAAEGIRTSLGRLVGTYDATPEEQMADIGKEAILSLAGEGLALGVKPTVKLFSKAFKKFENVPNFTKEQLASVIEGTNGTPAWAARRVMDGTDNVLSHTDMALKKIGPQAPTDQAVDVLMQEQTKLVKKYAPVANQKLQAQYAKDTADLLKAVPENFKADMKEVTTNALTFLENEGYGKTVELGGKKRFQLYSNEELAKQFGMPTEQIGKRLGPETRKGMQELVKVINDLNLYGTASGKQGAAKVLQLRKSIRDNLDGVFNKDAPDEVKRVAYQLKNTLYEGMGKPFADAGLGSKYLAINQNYAAKKDAVNLLMDAASSDNPQAVDNLVKQLSSKAGAYRSVKDEAKSLSDLIGLDIVNNLTDMEAAKHFVSYVPAKSGGNSFQTAVKGSVGRIASPRATAASIKYGNKMIDSIKGMGEGARNALLNNPVALRQFLQIPAQAMSMEEEQANALFEQAMQQSSSEPGSQ